LAFRRREWEKEGKEEQVRIVVGLELSPAKRYIKKGTGMDLVSRREDVRGTIRGRTKSAGRGIARQIEPKNARTTKRAEQWKGEEKTGTESGIGGEFWGILEHVLRESPGQETSKLREANGTS